MKEKEQVISVFGARVHNLKNIDVSIPRNQLVVFTGPSGSGKSSLAFDTIYAEGQRRYIETFSAYARQFLGNLERPDVDKIEGLSPVISIEQKTVSKNPRSTVGTITEIYDFIRLLFAKVSTAYSKETGEVMISYTEEQIKNIISKDYQDKKIILLAPLVRSRKGHYRELFHNLAKKGFYEVRTDGELRTLEPNLKLDRFKTHDIELVVDKLKVNGAAMAQRLSDAIALGMRQGNHSLLVLDSETGESRLFSKQLSCPSTGISYALPEPNTFSFNSPKGACPSCNGMGYVKEIALDKLFPSQNISIISCLDEQLKKIKTKRFILQQVGLILEKNGCKPDIKIEKIPEKAMNEILYGLSESVTQELTFAGVKKKYKINFDGVLATLNHFFEDKSNNSAASLSRRLSIEKSCPSCKGLRLKEDALYFKIGDRNIGDIVALSLSDLREWVLQLKDELGKKEMLIAEEIIKELSTRLQFLLDVGLEYLSLNRATGSLSGGEAQRIRLATQIGTELVNVLYILDEPSIGLHSRDNNRLIQSLQKLKDIGNSVIVVEHDKDMMLQSDFLVDIGPGAGKHGGEIIWHGTPSDIKKAKTITAQYLNAEKEIPIPKKRRKGNGDKLILKGAQGHNLKNVNLELPLGCMICVAGVSGSGKSTLINETLYPILSQHFYTSNKDPLPYKEIKGLEHLDKVIDIDQSPIGRTPRSNPATYTGVFSDIRNLFAQLPEAKIRGYQAGRFSFNVAQGRCPTCEGAGLKLIEMNFLPDIYVPCESCEGKRFNRETLEVRYKGKSIADVLGMTIDTATEFFAPIPKIYKKLEMLQQVGLGYISLGQSSTTLSGGEAQRVKLATALAKKQTGKTFYILDEPTTGLHFEDINILMNVLHQLVDYGNTVLIIEHNLDVLKQADYLIEIGPEGGQKGGKIIASGLPEEIALKKKSPTGPFLKKELGL